MTARSVIKPMPYGLSSLSAAHLRQGLIVVGIALLTLIVRLPFRHFVDDDEAFYALVGQRWLHGILPYAGSYDVKPPLLFGIFAIFQALFGASLATIKTIEIVFTIWGALALQRGIARTGAYSVSLWAGGLYPLLSLAQAGTDSANALLLSPFIISAFSAMSDATTSGATSDDWQSWKQVFLAGLWIGLAGMVKQTAAFEALGLAGFMLWRFRHEKPVQTLLVFAMGVALPALLFSAYFAATGHVGDAFRAVVLGAINRGGLKISLMDDSGLFWIVHFILLISPLMIPLMLSMLALVRRDAILKLFPTHLFWLAVVWVVSAASGCIAGHSALRYYGSTLIAPLLILSGAYILYAAPTVPWRRGLTLSAAVLATLACVVLVERDGFGLTHQPPGDDIVTAHATALELKRLGYTSSDSLLVPRRGLFTYIEADTLPTTHYFHTMHLMCDFPTPDAAPLVLTLAANPRFIVLSDPVRRLNCENPRYQGLIDATLKGRYRLDAIATGRWSRSLIYERKP